ncbi:hypothetical protein F5Y14DRAFT_206020 [Nemania sp. NC0429]|nr:hypothetical protein F5Y14DRAFT_206020 [Nemania sp. NC0429]
MSWHGSLNKRAVGPPKTATVLCCLRLRLTELAALLSGEPRVSLLPNSIPPHRVTLSHPSPLSSAPAAQTPSSQPLTPHDTTIAVAPQVTLCVYCGRSFSPQRLITHQRPKRNGDPPPCTVRYSCEQPGEPGCDRSFAHKRDRERHRTTVCKQTQAHGQLKSGFQCCCKKTIKRWYQFKKHHDRCSVSHQNPGVYTCQCGASFTDMNALTEHHKSEMGKPGRPRKGRLLELGEHKAGK